MNGEETTEIKRFYSLEMVEIKNDLYVYGLSLFFSLAVIFGSFFFAVNAKPSDLLLFFLISVILSSYFGHFRSGVLSMSLISLYYVYFFIPNFDFLQANLQGTVLPLILFISESSLIAYLIDKAKRVDEVAKYKLKQQEIAQLLLLEQKKNLQALDDIKARDEFLSIVSHELKTPLTSMLLQIQRALHNISNVSLAHFSVENLMKMLESVENQTDRLSKMISDLSNLSLITTGRLKLDVEEVDLGQLTRDVIEKVPSTLGKKDDYPISLEIKKEVKGRWDKLRIEQVLINLISNAIKYGDNKPVEVFVERDGNLGRIIVQDNGIGIPKKLQNKIFERFERGVDGKNYQGLGVGLYITQQIIAAHGGKIKIESKEHKGSKFIVELPLYKV